MSGYDDWKTATPPAYEDGEPARTVPAQKPGRSRQDYGTPRAFLDAVELRFGSLQFDLAATTANMKAPAAFCFDAGDEALSEAWDAIPSDWNLWLNPPYDDIAPWAAKCAAECTYRHGLTFLLVPASVGSNWFEGHVKGRAMVFALSPRLTFEGETNPYPKDLILCVYGMGFHGFDTWRWK